MLDRALAQDPGTDPLMLVAAERPLRIDTPSARSRSITRFVSA